MRSEVHQYSLKVRWTGNRGEGTSRYGSYDRTHIISAAGKPDLPGSADVAFRGDADRYNPEELLVAALSACHMLWYLHLCADAGIVVTGYSDTPQGILKTSNDGSGNFSEVLLHPVVTLADGSQAGKANSLHVQAHTLCYIARSCNFPVLHQATSITAGDADT